MLEEIPFKKGILTKLGFIKDDNYVVFGLPDNGAYIKFIAGYNDIIVKNENGEWVLVIRNDNAFYGCEFHYIPFLHIFQNLVSDYWHINI